MPRLAIGLLCALAGTLCVGSCNDEMMDDGHTGASPTGGTGLDEDSDAGAEPAAVACLEMVTAMGNSGECASCLCENCNAELTNCQANQDLIWAADCAAVVECTMGLCCEGEACYSEGCSVQIDTAAGGPEAYESGACDVMGQPANACAAANALSTCMQACPSCTTCTG